MVTILHEHDLYIIHLFIIIGLIAALNCNLMTSLAHFSFRTTHLLSNCDQHVKVQLFGRSKKRLGERARGHFNFSKVLGGSEPIVTNSFKLCEKLNLTNYLIKSKEGYQACFLSYKYLKLKLRVILTGCIVALVSFHIKRITCLPMIGHLCDTIIVASLDKQ